MPQFAIMNDLIGVREETPSIKLHQAYITKDSQFVYHKTNAIRRMPGRSTGLAGVQTPDTNPILRYHFHRSVSGSDYVFAYTKANAYIWDSVNEEWDLMFTCASDCEYWSTASYNGKVVSTNFVDKVQVWLESTPTTAFADMGSASGIDVASGVTFLTRAKFVFVYENYLHFLYTEEGGTTYAGRHRWSSRGDESDFDEDGAGDAGARDYTAGLWITGVGKYDAGASSLLVVFTNETIEIEWLVVEDIVFEWDTHKHELGCAAPDSVVNDPDGNLYFLGTDRAMHRFLDANKISDDIDKTIRNTHPTLNYYTRGYYVRELHRIFWAIPTTGASTGNDKVICLNLDLMTWDAELDMAVSAFGKYTNTTSYTIDTIPFASIDTIGWDTIDAPQSVVGWPQILSADYSGYSWLFAENLATDKGAEYTSEFILATDFTSKQSLNENKRIDGGFWVWFKRYDVTSRDATISVKENGAGSYTQLATVDMTAGNDDIVRAYCPCSFRGKDFLFKISTTGDFAFYGILFRFTFDGER